MSREITYHLESTPSVVSYLSEPLISPLAIYIAIGIIVSAICIYKGDIDRRDHPLSHFNLILHMIFIIAFWPLIAIVYGVLLIKGELS